MIILNSEKYYPKQDLKILDIGQTNGRHMHYKNRSQENTLRKKRTSQAPNLYSYHDKSKDRCHTIKFLRNAANQRKIPSFKSDDDPQYKCGVQTAHGRCWTVVSRLVSTDKYFCTHDENQTKISQELLISRPATCQVAIAGEHFFAAKLVRGVKVVLCWKLLFSTRT